MQVRPPKDQAMREQDRPEQQDHENPAGHITPLPFLAEATSWLPVASGKAVLRTCAAQGPDGDAALRLDYDFGGGGGFVVVRREVTLELPESWELDILLRGAAPPNTLEVKLVDDAGTSVWRWKREAFVMPHDWTRVCVESRDAEFAWGPAGGGSIRRTSALEIAVVAAPGGAGYFEVSGFRLVDRSLQRAVGLSASSSAGGDEPAYAPTNAIDGNRATTWRSAPGDGPHTLTMDLGAEHEIGGLVLEWDAAAPPKSFRIEAERAEGVWENVYDAARAGASINYVELPAVRARRLRVAAMPLRAQGGVGIADIDLKPVEWSRSPAEFLTNVALASRRGAWPRYLLREQSYWTPVATSRSGPVGLISDDGAVEVGEGGFILEPSLLVANDDGSAPTWLTWADMVRSARLEEAPLPVATVDFAYAGLSVSVTAVAEDAGCPATLLVRYRVGNTAAVTARGTLLVALRPFQVTPPWQSFRSLGGPSPISKLAWTGDAACVNDAITVRPLTPCEDFHAAAFDEGGVAASLALGRLPARSEAADPAGRAEGVFAFDVVLDAGTTTDVFIECRFESAATREPDEIAPGTGGDRAKGAITRSPRPDAEQRVESAATRAARLEAALDEWRRALPPVTIKAAATTSVAAHAGPFEAHQVAATAVAHILACRDGAALRPGPRRYTRSWIRDGVIMGAALLRAGRGDAARAFAQWYAPFQRGDGFVPCCVDREGVDPLVEHDSHGQFVYAVAEDYRFTRDAQFARSLWPQCSRAATFIEALRSTRKTEEFRSGWQRACFGLMPESVSHEGYLSQPVHSYWDDFWALRGLRDAAFLAGELGHHADAERWHAAAADLADAIETSMRIVMEDRGLTTVPASVEWADFDSTAVAGAISLVHATELFPPEALHRTFDEYLRGFRARSSGTVSWNNYTPYEVRIVGALVRVGRRDDANEVLDILLADCLPPAWNQWPEIVWPDRASPAHLGDLPHCWIGAEYVIALRSMLVFERGGALVIGAGLRRDWIDGEGLEVKAVPTWFGMLDLSIHPKVGGGWRVVVGGSAKPPGGFVVELPDADVSLETA
ncbi:MAG: discoidin domain-containing protein [Candidatus Binatia bacterium]